MSEEKVSATGERGAMGGYLPQFDEFAWFVYLNLINKKLEWIRIADPKAEKLDDIQYSTYSEIHAYQVKWTIAEANISYINFTDLIPLVISSWKSLKSTNPDKKIIPHLITNKPVSSHDNLKDGKIRIGSFKEFMSEVWIKIKSNQTYDDKWEPIISELKMNSKLDDSEFEEFVSCFDFQPNYKQKQFSVGNVKYSKEDEDLQQISRFIVEKVASPERLVEFNRQEIINELGWSDRFKTIFNHELIVDRQRYQPIQSTIELLNSKLIEHNNGYLFLQGGPGSGKSTLLNQWSKSIKTRIVRYYAFDFVNPSSHLNFYERGNATHLFFDLVFQLKEAGIYQRDILPYKDLIFLKEVFNEQLIAIGQDFINDGQPTIIIIDGLDHVPREYKSTANSFLRELPSPSSLPEGVFIILGSQSYELEDIQQEIKTEFQNGNRTILIDPLKKEEVYKYINTFDFSVELNSSQKLQIFEKSQGHPLYLSYLIEKVNKADSIDDTIESFVTFDGSIDNYYKKIWEPVQEEESLIHFLGLIARINGSINVMFIQEWEFDRNVLKSFKEKARVLFNETENTLSFFHNSFKQFLLHHTSLNYLTDEFDPKINLSYHNQLAGYYMESEVEKSWKQNHHLYQANQYNEFVSKVTPDNFTFQLLNFRPVEEIRQDAKLGIEIALQTKNINTLIKYLFSLAEIEKRLYNIDPASFTEELLILNKHNLARDYLRTGNILHCSESYAFKASRLFIEFGYKSEGATLFNLAYPEFILDSEILIADAHNFEEIRDTLEEWIYVAHHFEDLENILQRIHNISYPNDFNIYGFEEKQEGLPIILLTHLGYSLVDYSKWDDFNKVIEKIDTTSSRGKNSLFLLIKYGIEQCLELKDKARANKYLSLLTEHFTKEKAKPIGKIYIADFIYKVNKDIDETLNWIIDLKQPSIVGGEDELGYGGSLDIFIPLIKLNKLLNLCSKGVSITSAIPSVKMGTDERVLVEFERMLCLITQILSDGILQNPISSDITKRISPIVRFYYKDISHRNNYWYKLQKTKEKYFDFLITAVSEINSKSLDSLGDYLFNEFRENPKYWNTSVQREIIKSLLINGFDLKKSITQLRSLEQFMLEDRDIDGRITECLTHSDLWLLIEKPEEGEKWLKQAIQESIGVGYRKDYQFSTWIDWLRKINRKDSLNAPNRIKWFLSHLNHIKDTTEGRAYWNASQELLEATLEHNLYDGFKQLIWQLEHDLVDFRDSISLFIEYFVKRVKNEKEFKSITLLYNDLYLLLSEAGNAQLLKQILIKGYEVQEKGFLEKSLPEIVTAINIKAYEENRYYLLTEINSFFLSKGIVITDYILDFKIPSKKQKGESNSSSNTLTLKKDYKKIDEKEVLDKISNFEDFKKIIQEEDPANSYFDWSKVIEKIAPLLSESQIEEVANLAINGRKGAEFFAKLSEIAFEQEHQKLAESLAHRSINLSSQSGWVKYYDGGTRIKAFNALKNVNPTLSSNKAFEIFTHDIVNGNYPNSYIEHLEDIVPLLTEDYNEENLWIEIFAYLQRLMSNSKPTEDLPEILSMERSISETLVDYLVYLTTSPISLIKEKSIIIIAQLISLNNNYALTQLQNKKLDDYTSMDIIIALFELDSPFINVLIPRIQDLALSNDYQLRTDSKNILTTLREEIPTPKNIKLPSVYSLHIPEPLKPEFNKKRNPYFPEVDINDSRDLILPFENLINILSRASGVNQYNLIYRTHSIMKEIGREEEWTVEYEKALRYHLEEIYLKYSYPRPRVIAARRAIMQVTCELIDSGIIDGSRFERALKSHDYSVLFFKELPKPSFIQVIKERDSGGVGTNWLNRLNESPRLTEPLLDYGKNFKIIAEYSQVKNLDWGAPTEEYMSQIAVDDKLNEDEEYIFGSVFHQLSSNYHNLNSVGHFITVIRDHRFSQFNLKSKWIAINPSLATHLGWEPELNKLFAWKNSKDELMAESIYWSNGNIDLTPRSDGDVGEGWYVIVSEGALKQIKQVEKNLYIQKKITRSKFENSSLENNEIFKVIKL